jgi:hypothetical protein
MKPTISFLKPRAESRCRVLPPGWRVRDQADACRSAALAFAWCAGASWGKRELARWLVGPYATAVEATRETAASETSRHRAANGLATHRSLSDEAVRELLTRSHAHVLAMLRSCTSWKTDDALARLMVDGGVVVGIIDEQSSIGYGPVASENMPLVDRVTALFVADLLTRPGDYARFRICNACEKPTFDADTEHLDVCESAARGSGTRDAVAVIPSQGRRRITLVGLGDGRAA